MVAQTLSEKFNTANRSHRLTFAGDNVRLFGQIDYPSTTIPTNGYPLIFVLPHTGCTHAQDGAHYTRVGLQSGYAVFRWDKRGTGHSGCGEYGSPAIDALKAYQYALKQPNITPNQVIILAQNEGTVLLGERYTQIAEQQEPAGVILVGNMLKYEKLQPIQAPLHIVMGEKDWNNWQVYAETACEKHRVGCGHPSTYYVAANANHRLIDAGTQNFHTGALDSIQAWLEKQWPTSTSN